jgi:hypothetical protein
LSAKQLTACPAYAGGRVHDHRYASACGGCQSVLEDNRICRGNRGVRRLQIDGQEALMKLTETAMKEENPDRERLLF